MKMKFTSAFITGLIMFGATYVCAETDPQSKPLIDTPISTVHMGNLRQIKLVDGTVVKVSKTNLREEPIKKVDFIGARHLQFGMLTVANRGLPWEGCPGPTCFCWRCGGGCKFMKTLLADETYEFYLDRQGEIERVGYPDGTVVDASSLYHEHPLKDVDVLEYRPYILGETRDTSTGKSTVQVLVP
jgi:hypothetical protein